MPQLVAFTHFELVSDYYQPEAGWAASGAVVLALLIGYVALAAKPLAVRRRVVRRALAAAVVSSILCVAIPWILQRGFAIPTWIVDLLNGVHVVAYVALFSACASALAAKFFTLRVDELSERLTTRQLDELQRAIEQATVGRSDDLAVALAKADIHTISREEGASLSRNDLQDADAQGTLADLIGALRRANRANALLADAESRLLRTADATDRPRLEGMVLQALQHRPAAEWLREVEAAFRSVCRVERASDGASIATGFLIGPGLVLTNHHVVFPGGSSEAVAVQFRFDALTDTAGIVIPAAFPSAVVVASPPGGTERGLGTDPGPDELDFAVLRFDPSGAGLPARKPLRVDGVAGPASVGLPLVILEHPLGGSLQICMGSVTGSNTTGTRLRHNATTQRGSSGSPCLSMDLAVFALHNGGRGTLYNNAIPMARILSVLRRKGLAID